MGHGCMLLVLNPDSTKVLEYTYIGYFSENIDDNWDMCRLKVLEYFSPGGKYYNKGCTFVIESELANHKADPDYYKHFQGKNLVNYVNSHADDADFDAVEMKMCGNYPPVVCRYSVNHTKREYVDNSSGLFECDDNDVHPHPLLLLLSNKVTFLCHSYGTYPDDISKNLHLLYPSGVWRGDAVSCENEIPEGYTELDPSKYPFITDDPMYEIIKNEDKNVWYHQIPVTSTTKYKNFMAEMLASVGIDGSQLKP